MNIKINNIIKATLLAGALNFQISQAATLTVGVGDDCGFPNILTAINFAADGDTVAVAVGEYTGVDAQLNIDKSIILKGGLTESCQDFTEDKTVLQTDLEGPVINVDVSGGKEVTINGFDISGAQVDILNSFSSGVAITGAGTVTIEETFIHDNKSFLGGGVSATNGSTLYLQNNTEIYANMATGNGGGVYCFDCTLFAIDTIIGKSENEIDLGNIVTANNGFGGGVFMDSASASFLGKSPNGTGSVIISYNKSDEGAGIYLKDTILISNHPDNTISFNEVEFFGAAAMLEGSAFLNIVNGKVMNNIGSNIFSTTETAQILIESDNDGCNKGLCAQLSGNITSVGLFRMQGDSNVTIKRVKSDNNSEAFAFVNTSNDNGLTVSNSIISNHDVSFLGSLIKVQGASPKVLLTNVTISNNSGASIFKPSSGAKLVFDGGIIWGNTATNLSDLTNIENLGVINSIIQYDSTGMENTMQSDPLFVSAANNNYHLQFGSPAIDHFVGTTLEDMDGGTRPQGDSHDAGADEWADLIFVNGFELK